MSYVLALSCGLFAWSLVANLVIGDHLYVARNLLLTVLLLLLARWSGLSWRELGLGAGELGQGIRWGRAAVLAVVVAVALGAALAEVVPAIGVLLSDQRAAVGPGELAWIALVRIPFGTAVFEEVAFRGLLLAVLLGVTTTGWAVVWSSVIFRLWHVAPTIVALRINEVAPAGGAGVRAIVLAVAVTALAGVVFDGLRLLSGSLVAPVLAHWAANATGLLAAAVTQATTPS